MKIKKSKDKMVTVPGYVMDVEPQTGCMSIRTEYGYGGDYVLPDDYVCVTMSDPEGREIYVLAPKGTLVTEL